MPSGSELFSRRARLKVTKGLKQKGGLLFFVKQVFSLTRKRETTLEASYLSLSGGEPVAASL